MDNRTLNFLSNEAHALLSAALTTAQGELASASYTSFLTVIAHAVPPADTPL